jgi:MoaA/NifB/PqqE/SkfB family radical SAM enzyme
MKTYDIMGSWTINTSCNFKCPYCHPILHDEVAPGSGSKKEIEKIVQFFDKTKKTWLIIITGGEPFLYPNFIELCKKLSKKHYISIITNLSSDLAYRFCKEINPKRVGWINCSLHITERERLGLNKDVIKKIKLLKKHKFRINVTQVMWPPAIEKFDGIFEYFKKHGIVIKPIGFKGIYNGKKYPDSYKKREREKMEYYLNIVSKNYRKEKNNPYFFEVKPKIDAKELAKKYADVGNKNKKVTNIFRGNLSFKGIPCLTGKTFVRIDDKGDIIRCLGSRTKLGNIYKGRIKLFKRIKKCKSKICICYFDGIRHALGSPKIVKLPVSNKIISKISLILSRIKKRIS